MSKEVTLTVLDPRAQRWTPPVQFIQPRLSTLNGKNVAIVHNGKPGATYIRPYVETVLKERYPGVEFKEFVISYNDYPEKAEDMKRAAAWADAVIGMFGD